MLTTLTCSVCLSEFTECDINNELVIYKPLQYLRAVTVLEDVWRHKQWYIPIYYLVH